MCSTVSTLLFSQFVFSYLCAFAHILYQHARIAMQKYCLWIKRSACFSVLFRASYIADVLQEGNITHAWCVGWSRHNKIAVECKNRKLLACNRDPKDATQSWWCPKSWLSQDTKFGWVSVDFECLHPIVWIKALCSSLLWALSWTHRCKRNKNLISIIIDIVIISPKWIKVHPEKTANMQIHCYSNLLFFL